MNMKRTIFFIFCALALAAGSYLIGNRHGKRKALAEVEQRTDTLIVTDTIRVSEPVYVTKTILRTDTMRLAVIDTLIVRDSVLVQVPIERREYRDTSYYAVVSGYRASLDYIETYERVKYITLHSKDKARWGIGVQAGYGYSVHGGSPYVGVGVSWNVIRW